MATENDGKPKQPAVISLAIKDKKVLFSAYIGYFKEGGIFIPTNKTFNLYDEVALSLTLFDEPEKYPVTGKVAWVTPVSAQGNRVPGIGIHFMPSNEAKLLREKIETIIAAGLKSDNPTHTM